LFTSFGKGIGGLKWERREVEESGEEGRRMGGKRECSKN